ncbi:MAG: murein transglycosylase A [Bacteroidota bacterium]
MSPFLRAHQLQGNDEKGSVYYTGYFTPILKVSEKPTDEYRYPLYSRPLDWVGTFPTRAEIDGEQVLAGQGLELAYASNPVDVYFMQVQGSGIVEFTDGRRILFANNGDNGHRYRSIGRYMIENGLTTPQYVSINSIRNILGKNPEWMDEVLYSNPSYVFFQPRKARPSGAGQVPLTADYSIAVDPQYIPLGSCLLASVPVHDQRGNFTHHEYRVLLAQDTGGAINGPGHVDVYTGIGKQAKREAGYTHHYGNMWLLLPNEDLLASLP